MNQIVPAYPCDLLQQYVPKRGVLGSATKELLAIPKNKTVTYGDRAFSVAGTDCRIFYEKHKPLTVLKTVLKHFCLEKLSYDQYRLNLYFVI